MSRRERIRRPPIDRTEPRRHWSGMFHSPEEEPDGYPGPTGEPAGDGSRADEVAEGVELGYGVIEDYLERGRRAARSRSGHIPGWPFAGAGFGSPAAVSDQITPWLRASQHLGRAWLELVRTLAGGAAWAGSSPLGGSQAGPFSDPFAPAEEPGFRGAAFGGDAAPANGFPSTARAPAVLERISLEMSSKRPIRVALDLEPNADLHALVLGELRCRDRDAPPLDGVRLERASDEASLRLLVDVPEQAAAALYTARVFDARNGAPLGVLCLHVMPGD